MNEWIPQIDTLLYFNELPKLHVENKKTSQFPRLQNSHKTCL